jgi:hypothetical protein
MTSSMMNSPSPYLLRPIKLSASIMKVRSSAVGVFLCSPSTTMGVSHESQSSNVNLNGNVKLAYQGVYSFKSHKSHLTIMARL